MPENLDTALSLPPLPGWIAADRADTAADAAYVSGAALAHLHQLQAHPAVPLALWREGLALRAAEACTALDGRRESAGALRDALLFTRPGDNPGPAGSMLQRWLRAVALPISVGHLVRALDSFPAAQIGACLDTPGTTAVNRAAGVIEAVLAETPRAEAMALVLAEAVLAKGLGWAHLVPLLSLGLGARDLRLRGDDLRLACHRAVVAGAKLAVPQAAGLARAAARLQAVAPRLLAKPAGRAVVMFLAHDALTPSALSFMSDRAARRLCDRLVDLGAIHELTRRDAFRAYGL